MQRDTLTKLHELTKAVNDAKEFASELLRTAQDRFKEKTHTLQRADKEIEVAEKVLWEEVFHLGPDCQAGEILKAEHPEVFEAYLKQDAAADELKVFTLKELGVDYKALTLSDYLRMTEGLVELMLAERGNFPVKSPIQDAGSTGGV